MSLESAPDSLDLPMSALVGLAIEYWRLSAWLAPLPSAGTAPARHVMRKLEDFLKLCELEVRTMDGHPFDAGLAVRVVDTVDDPKLPKGRDTIDQTLSPLVVWRGRVIKAADVVTRRGTA